MKGRWSLFTPICSAPPNLFSPSQSAQPLPKLFSVSCDVLRVNIAEIAQQIGASIPSASVEPLSNLFSAGCDVFASGHRRAAEQMGLVVLWMAVHGERRTLAPSRP